MKPHMQEASPRLGLPLTSWANGCIPSALRALGFTRVAMRTPSCLALSGVGLSMSFILWESLVDVKTRSKALSNMALRANGLGASRRAARALLPPFFSQKTQAPSQGRSLMLWQLSLLLHSWPLFPSLHVTSNSYSKAMSCREPST